MKKIDAARLRIGMIAVYVNRFGEKGRAPCDRSRCWRLAGQEGTSNDRSAGPAPWWTAGNLLGSCLRDVCSFRNSSGVAGDGVESFPPSRRSMPRPRSNRTHFTGGKTCKTRFCSRREETCKPGALVLSLSNGLTLEPASARPATTHVPNACAERPQFRSCFYDRSDQLLRAEEAGEFDQPVCLAVGTHAPR